MKAERLLAVAASAAVVAVLACAACAQPRTPESAANTEGDGGDLTCDEKARAQSVCAAALHQRCESLGNQCDLGCGPPGGNMTDTSTRLGEAAPDYADYRTAQCRDNCRNTRDNCLGSIARRCPVPCQ